MTNREKAISIFNAAVSCVQPEVLIPAHLFMEGNVLHIFEDQFLVDDLPKIFVIGAGKASAAMAKIVEDILGDLISDGIVITKYQHAVQLQKIRCYEAAHPEPDEQGVAHTAKTIQLLQNAGENDIIICLISGGASALWIDIPDGATLDEVQETYQLLIKSGASIDEVNIVRTHLSVIKGGRLLQYAPKARWFSFIISDVPGDVLPDIASGPTVPVSRNFAIVDSILEKYALRDQLPSSILQCIRHGSESTIDQKTQTSNPVVVQVQNKVIGSNRILLKAAEKKAIELGYHIALVNTNLSGNAATIGRELVCASKAYQGLLPACLLLGGETTVIVKGAGKGGRNQHMALSALLEMAIDNEKHTPINLTFLSAGTDGTDGPTDAAGAIADSITLSKAREINLNGLTYFNDNDAYHYFEQTGGLLKTGPTQTNVMDLVVVIIEKMSS